jgi:DNA-binding YbaB/EbfC family protein
MFGQLGQIAGLLRQLPKLREEAEKFHAKLGEINAEGSAGGDMVTVRVNGRMEILKVTITDAAYALHDREMLEDMVAAATNAALAKARDQVNVEAQSMAASMGLPPGMDLPGMR